MRKYPRFVLVVGDDGAMLVPFHGDMSLAPLFAAARDEAAKKDILDYLHQYPKSSVTVLANGLAQEFRIETLPPVNIFDRLKLIQRRSRRRFRKPMRRPAAVWIAAMFYWPDLRKGEPLLRGSRFCRPIKSRLACCRSNAPGSPRICSRKRKKAGRCCLRFFAPAVCGRL